MTQGDYATHGDRGNASHLMPGDDKAPKGRLGHLWFLPILAIGHNRTQIGLLSQRQFSERTIMNSFIPETPLKVSDPDTQMTMTTTACPPQAVLVKNLSDRPTFIQAYTGHWLSCDIK